MRIRLDQIDASHKQGALHRPGVKMYREMVRARKKLPPLRLECGRRGQYELLDGFPKMQVRIPESASVNLGPQPFILKRVVEALPTDSHCRKSSDQSVAVQQAALRVRAKLARLAGWNPDEVSMSRGRIVCGEKSRSIQEVMNDIGTAELASDGAFDLPNGAPVDMGSAEFPARTFGVIFVEVGVDPDLGLLRLRRATGVYSARRIINLMTARSQMIGGIVWGWGMAAMEGSHFEPSLGRWLAKDLAGVPLPVNADIPPAIDVGFVDEFDANFGPLGAKGIGETGATGVAAAVGNAVFDAIGIRIRDLQHVLRFRSFAGCGKALIEVDMAHLMPGAPLTLENPTLADRRRKAIVLQEIQPGLLGLMDGSVSTLAPIFAAAGLTGRPLSAFFVGLAASLGAAISMGLSEALSDDGRKKPYLAGAIPQRRSMGRKKPYLAGVPPATICKNRWVLCHRF
jgi:hypothetical protein